MSISDEREAQYLQVYAAIGAIASHCDGARTQDGVGFNGQDTKFGRRVASVPFEDWTDAVKQETARIVLLYKVQAESYTGVDVSTLQVVKDAQEGGTSYAARDDARGYERKTKSADKVALRKIDAVGDKLAISFDKKDPEFKALLADCQALPNRKFDWDHKAWMTLPSDEVEEFILTWDFPITEAAKLLLSNRQPELEHFEIDLEDDTHVVITTPYNPDMLGDLRDLPGRDWKGPRKVNLADACGAVLAFAQRWKLSVSPHARAACEAGEKALEAAAANAGTVLDIHALMGIVSRLGDPEAVPEVFCTMVDSVIRSGKSYVN